jgi:hypothetical protein
MSTKSKATKPVLHVAADTITDTMKVKAVKLDGLRSGKSKIRGRLAKIRVGMSVADVLAKCGISRYDLSCAVPRGRIVLTGK